MIRDEDDENYRLSVSSEREYWRRLARHWPGTPEYYAAFVDWEDAVVRVAEARRRLFNIVRTEEG